MGKVKRERRKYHLSPGTKSAQDTAPPQDAALPDNPVHVPVPDNPFAGMEILFDNLKKTLKDSDTISVKTSKSTSSAPTISKKEKRKLRHEAFLRKLEAAYQTMPKFKNKKKAKRVQKEVPLSDKLPELNLDMKADEKKDKKPLHKLRSTPKAKHRKETMMQDFALLKNLLNDPEIKSDPILAVSSRVQEKVYQDLEKEALK